MIMPNVGVAPCRRSPSANGAWGASKIRGTYAARN